MKVNLRDTGQIKSNTKLCIFCLEMYEFTNDQCYISHQVMSSKLGLLPMYSDSTSLVLHSVGRTFVFLFPCPETFSLIQFIQCELFMAMSQYSSVSKLQNQIILVFTKDTFLWITYLENPDMHIMTVSPIPHLPPLQHTLLYGFSKF